MKVLITGVAGYIGATFCIEALRRGFNVIGIDNFSNSRKETILEIKKRYPKSFKFLENDLSKPDVNHLSDNFRDIDAVVHFAALKSVPESEKFPDLYYKNNVKTTENVIDLMTRSGVKKLVFSSSAAVYGDQEIQPINESALLKPKSVYAETKKISEESIEIAVQNRLIKAISLRYFNPLGSHDEKIVLENHEDISGNIMAKILNAALGLSEKITVYGNDYPTKDGTGERDYIHIKDVIDAHFKALRHIDVIERHEKFNLGTGISVSVIDLIETFNAVNKCNVRYEISGRRKGDVAMCFANPSKANKELDWFARYNLETMCKDAWEAKKNAVN